MPASRLRPTIAMVTRATRFTVVLFCAITEVDRRLPYTQGRGARGRPGFGAATRVAAGDGQRNDLFLARFTPAGLSAWE